MATGPTGDPELTQRCQRADSRPRRCLATFACLGGLLSLAVAAAPDPVGQSAEYQFNGRVERAGSQTSLGSDYVLRGATDRAGGKMRGANFVVAPAATVSSGCLCMSSIFEDGFESGDTSAWN